MSSLLPEIPPALEGWQWEQFPNDEVRLLSPDGWATKNYTYSTKAIAEALRRVNSRPKPKPIEQQPTVEAIDRAVQGGESEALAALAQAPESAAARLRLRGFSVRAQIGNDNARRWIVRQSGRDRTLTLSAADLALAAMIAQEAPDGLTIDDLLSRLEAATAEPAEAALVPAPDAPGALSQPLQDCARRAVAADRKGGEALLEKAAALADARSLAKHGEWAVFLEAIGVNERAGRRLIAIHERAATDTRFADAVRRGWLTFSVAAIAAQADDALLDQLLTQEEPPTRSQIEAATKPDTGVRNETADDAAFADARTRFAALGWRLERHGIFFKLVSPDDRRYVGNLAFHLERLIELEAGAALSAALRAAQERDDAPFWQAMSSAHPAAHLWTRAGMGTWRSACGMTATRGPSGSRSAGHCSRCEASRETRTGAINRPDGAPAPAPPAKLIPADIRQEAARLGLVVESRDGGILLYWPDEADDLDGVISPISEDEAREWLASDALTQYERRQQQPTPAPARCEHCGAPAAERRNIGGILASRCLECAAEQQRADVAARQQLARCGECKILLSLDAVAAGARICPSCVAKKAAPTAANNLVNQAATEIVATNRDNPAWLTEKMSGEHIHVRAYARAVLAKRLEVCDEVLLRLLAQALYREHRLVDVWNDALWRLRAFVGDRLFEELLGADEARALRMFQQPPDAETPPTADPLASVRSRLEATERQLAEGIVVEQTPATLETIADDLEQLADAPGVTDAAYEELTRRLAAAQERLEALGLQEAEA